MVGLGYTPVRDLPPPQPPPATRDPAHTLPNGGDNYFLPPGSVADPCSFMSQTHILTSLEFPCQNAEETYCDYNISAGDPQRGLMDSVTHVVGFPCVCGLLMQKDLEVRVSRVQGLDERTTPSLVDGGANICLTGMLDLLMDVVEITPLPISVATKTGEISLDDSCTKRGLLPLTLVDGSVYYQPCYYCTNAVETIISPQAILDASDVLVKWTQTGHKDGRSGAIRFDSDSGLISLEMTLENRDGLYYCPTDVYTVDSNPVRCPVPIVHRAVTPQPTVTRRHKTFDPVPPKRLTSELWMLRLGSPGKDQLDLLPGKVTGIPNGFRYHPFCFIDWKEEARIQTKPAGNPVELIEVSILSNTIRSRSIHSQIEKYLISIWRVRGVGFCAFLIAVHASLSSYKIVAASCGISKSHKMLRTNKIILPVSYAAINSASVDDPATVG